MAKLKIITAPNPILKQKSKPVDKIDKKIKKLAVELIRATKDKEGRRVGVGISAIQAGKPLRLFIAYSPKSKKDLVFINPKILWKSKKITSGVPEKENKFEGCLSIPGIFGLVKRSQTVKIRYLTLNERRVTRKFSGFTATVIQHEDDHLKGILFTERVLEQKSKLYQLGKDKEGKEIFVEMKLK